MLFFRLLIFVKIKFSKNSFRNTIRMSNSLDPDQAGRFVQSPYPHQALFFICNIISENTFFKLFFI